VTYEQSVGILPSASVCVTGADAAEVVRVVAALVVVSPEAGALEVQPVNPANARQAATATKRRIMRRG